MGQHPSGRPNAVTITNHGRKYEDGAWVADDTEHRGARPAGQVRPRQVSLDAYVTAPANLVVRLMWENTPHRDPHPRQAVLNAGDNGYPAALDLLDHVHVTHAGTRWVCLITGITHHITARAWHTTYDLTPHPQTLPTPA